MDLVNTEHTLLNALKLHQENNLPSAEKLYQSILKESPNHPLVLTLLGTIFIQRKEPKQAIEFFNKSIQSNPQEPLTFCNLGIAEYQLKRYESSLKNLNSAIKLKPDYVEAFNAKGNTLRKLGQNNLALESFNIALQINPNLVDAYLNRGDLFIDLNRLSEAHNDFKNATRVNPPSEIAIMKYADFLMEYQDFIKALIEYKKLIKMNPNNLNALLNCAACSEKCKDIEGAIKYYDLILNIDKNNIKALNNKGFIYQNHGNFKKALNLYEKVLEVSPFYPLTLLNIGIINLTKNKFSDGWKNFSYRINNIDNRIRPQSSKPELLDFNISNKTIFIWAEQGLGDQIIYSSLLPDALKTKNNFYVALEPRLLPLFKRSFSWANNVTFISAAEKLLDSKYDYQLPMGSLGKFFRNSIEDFSPQPTGYLKADEIKSNLLKQKLKKNKQNICGIAWMSKNKEFGEEKSLSLTQLLPILSLPNTIFVNLQYGDTSKEIKNISDQYGIEIISIDEIDNFNDIDGLASLIEACDYIVTSSNVTAHIAGALNKKTYLLLPYAYGKIWYWGENDTHSLWYPSIEIYRNTNSNSWEKPIADLSERIYMH
jgi:tetratricopeptide (TPR) repeat protein